MAHQGLTADHRPVIALLEQCPVYAATPLTGLDNLARKIGINALWAKDESTRMGLGAFKALGGSYAILELIRRSANLGPDSPLDISDPRFKQAAARHTFVCATAGNHGLGVAAAAKLFGAKAVVYISQSVPEYFADRLRLKDAEVVRYGGVYQDSLDGAMQAVTENGWQLIADTSWPEYHEIPRLIYQGYSVLAEECRQSYSDQNNWPSHVFLQAAVGGLAGALALHIREWWPVQPKIIVVEPESAPCLGHSVAAGKMVTVTGPVSSMGRLDCKYPSMLAFESLRETADQFIEISDAEGDMAVTRLEGAGIKSTSSGTAGLAGLIKLRDQEIIPADSACLIIISEGI